MDEQNAFDAIESNIIILDIDEDPPSEVKANLETNRQYIFVSTT